VISFSYGSAEEIWVEQKPLSVLTVGYVNVYAYSVESGMPITADVIVKESVPFWDGSKITYPEYSGQTPFSVDVRSSEVTVTCTYKGSPQTQTKTFPIYSSGSDVVLPFTFRFYTGGDVVTDPERTLKVTAYEMQGGTGLTELINARVDVNVKGVGQQYVEYTGGHTAVFTFKGDEAYIKCTWNGKIQYETMIFYSSQREASHSFYFESATPTPTTTTTSTTTSVDGDLPNRIKLGSVKGTIIAHYADGSSDTVSSSQSELGASLDMLKTKGAKSFDFYVNNIDLTDIQLEHRIYGQPTDYTMVIKGDFKILVNGKEEYTSPDSGEYSYIMRSDGNWPEDSIMVHDYAVKLSGMKQIPYSEKMPVYFSLEDWSTDKYVQGASIGDEITYTFKWSLSVTLKAIWLKMPMLTETWYTIEDVDKTQEVTDVVNQDMVDEEPTFTIGVSPNLKSIGINEGSTQTLQVIINAYNGFTAPISLSVADLPQGVTYSFSRETVTPEGTSTVNSVLTITASPTTKHGTYNPKIYGEGGGKQQTATFTLEVVQDAEPDDFDIKVRIKTQMQLSSGSTSYGRMEIFTLSGSVYDAPGYPVFGVTIQLTSNFDFEETITTDSEGEFSVEVEAPDMEGSFKIVAKCTSIADKYAKPDTRTFTFRVTDKLIIPSPKQLFDMIVDAIKDFLSGLGIDSSRLMAWAIIAIVVLALLFIAWLLWPMFVGARNKPYH